MPGRSREKKSNPILQWHRTDKGWSRAELARRVNKSIEAEKNAAKDAGIVQRFPKLIDAEIVKNWETRHGTRKDYAKHLCDIFDLSAGELGLLTARELALRSPGSHQPGTQPKSGMVGNRLLGSEIREASAMTTGEEGSNWGPALRAAGVPVDPDQEEVLVGARDRGSAPSRTDPKAVESYAAIVAHQRALYWANNPAALLDAASAHLALGAAMLGNDLDENRPLASSVAECALLVARLAFFDLDGLDSVAHAAFEAAETSVVRAQDHSLTVAVAAHQAFVPGFNRNLVDARPFLVAAERHWRRSERNPLVRSWLHCVSAEIFARSGEIKDSRYHLRQAQEYLTKSDGASPLWLDFFDSSRFAGFAGNTALLAGKHAEAVTWLQQALDALGPDTKQRSVVLLDLAAAHAADEPEQALTLAIEACDHLERDYYQTAVNRIPNVRAALSGSRSAARLTERAQRLLNAGPA